MKTTTTKYIVDNSFVACYILPDESDNTVDQLFEQFNYKRIEFIAPTILSYELGNILKSRQIRKLLPENILYDIQNNYLNLHLPLEQPDPKQTLKTAIEYNLSYYDASYLTLALKHHCPLLTLDNILKTKFEQAIKTNYARIET